MRTSLKLPTQSEIITTTILPNKIISPVYSFLLLELCLNNIVFECGNYNHILVQNFKLFSLAVVARQSYISGEKKINKPVLQGGGQVVRWCWVNFQFRGVLLIWEIVEQALAVGAVGVVWIFLLSSIVSSSSLSLGDGPI